LAEGAGFRGGVAAEQHGDSEDGGEEDILFAKCVEAAVVVVDGAGIFTFAPMWIRARRLLSDRELHLEIIVGRMMRDYKVEATSASRG
jgi:hypothetical protein